MASRALLGLLLLLVLCLGSVDSGRRRPLVASGVTQCSDAIDNDNDTRIDLGDPGCADAADNDETNAAPSSSITCPSPSAIASRTTGTAPLAVHFDATGTVHSSMSGTSQEFHELTYRWDFDDQSNGKVWPVSGQDKNVDFGPMAAHVFGGEVGGIGTGSGGTFDVTVTIDDGPGNADPVVCPVSQIVATAPDLSYSGNNTICVTDDGVENECLGLSCCPRGCNWSNPVQTGQSLCVQSSDFDAMLATHLGTNKRVLFKNGSTFSQNTPVVVTSQTGWTIGGYGEFGTAKPLVNSTAQVAFKLGNTNNGDLGNVDGRIMNLHLDGAGVVCCDDDTQASAFNRMLFYRIDQRDGGGTTFLSTNPNLLSGHGMNNEVFIVESTDEQDDGNVADGTYALYAHIERGAVLGSRFWENTIVTAGATGHILRFNSWSKLVVAHNLLSGGGRDEIKLHGVPATGLTGQYAVIRGNEIVSETGAWSTGTGPNDDPDDWQDTSADEIWENNLFRVATGNSAYQAALLLKGSQRITVRNNIGHVAPSGSGYRMALVCNGVVDGAASGGSDAWIHNNTLHSAGVQTNQIEVAQVDDGGGCAGTDWTGVVARNNLLFAPGSGGRDPVACDTACTDGAENEDESEKAASAVFEPGTFSSPPVAFGPASEYRLDDDATNADTIDAGASVPRWRDWAAQLVPRSAPDIGAFERGNATGATGYSYIDCPPSNLVASRLSGTAPLYVHFDATLAEGFQMTVPGQEFRELLGEWSFDDAGAGTWPEGAKASKESKETDRGVIAAHVFETAGTFDVTYTLTDAVGNVASCTVDPIVVAAPAVTFSGTNTVCASKTGDFSGCPGGCSGSGGTSNCQNVGGSATWESVLGTHLPTSNRVLFNRGEAYNANCTNDQGSEGCISMNVEGIAAGWQIGSYGEGAKPVITMIGGNTYALAASGNGDNQLWDAAIYDIDFRNGVAWCCSGDGNRNATRVLGLRIDTNTGGYHFYGGNSGNQPHTEIALIGGTHEQTVFGGPITVYTGSDKIAIMGNAWHRTTESDNTVQRLWSNRKTIVAHNFIGPGGADRPMYKFHGDTGEMTDGDYHLARFMLLRDNEMEARENQFNDDCVGAGNPYACCGTYVGCDMSPGLVGSTGPNLTNRGSAEDESLDFIMEDNLIRINYDKANSLFGVDAQRAEVRNNIAINLLTPQDAWNGFLVCGGSNNVTVDRNRIYNNTNLYMGSGCANGARIISGDRSAGCGGGPDPTNTVWANNLGYAPNATCYTNTFCNEGTHTGWCATITNTQNLEPEVAENNPFTPGTFSSPPLPTELQLTSGGVATDTGVSTVPVLRDFGLQVRPKNGNGAGGAEFDVGAWERQ